MHILEAGALCSIGARAYAGKGRSERCFTAYRAPAHCIQRAGRPHNDATGSKQPPHSWSQAFAVRFPALYGLQGTKRATGKRKAAGSVIFATALPLEAGEPSPLESLPTLLEKTGAFYRFSRPHTVIGTAIGVISVSLLAIQSISDFSPRFYVGLLQSLVPALCMNIYIVGLNQIYDIEIDKVNKPTLPLASGEYSVATAVKLVAGFAAASMGLGLAVGSKPLLAALTVSLVLGTAYSMDLPLLRWKRSAVAAATCILAVRAVVVQIAFYLHMQSFVFGRPGILTKPVLFATGFMCFFSVVIALAKDIPDVEGDKIFGIRSFSVKLGQKNVFWLCVWLLEAAYAVAIMVGASSHVLWSKLAMIAGHAALAAVLFFKSKSVDLKSKAAITSFYMFIWKLFYTEYVLIPFLR